MIQTAEYVEARIIAVLQAFLPMELTTIYVTEMGSDMGAAPSIVEYFSYEPTEMPQGPSITAEVKNSRDLGTMSTTNSPGVAHYEHDVVVSVHVKDTGNEGIASLKKHMQRIVRGAVRVLVNKYFTLSGTVVSVQHGDSDINYLAAGQGPGQYVRSGTIPLRVETYENL